MKYLKIIILFLFLPIFSFGQDTTFIKSYGLSGYNYGEKIIQTADQGYLILGNKSGFIGNTDIYLIKTNYYGKLLWDKAYGGSEIDWAEDIKQTKDNGFIITGYISTPENNDYNILLLKTDSDGNMKWMKNYGGGNWDFGHSLVETADSGYIIAGETYSFGNGNNDAFILKISKNGDSLWSKSYGGQNSDITYDISICHDGNFILTGITNSFGKGMFDAYLLKIDQLGDTLWTRTYGDTLDDKAFSGIETSDYGIVFTGSTMNFDANGQDGVIFKTDSLGNFLWERNIGGDNNEEFYEIIQNYDDVLFIAGYTESYGYTGTKDFYMVKTDKDGWFKFGPTYGGDNTDYANTCIPTFDHGFAIVGTSKSMGLGSSNILLVKTDSVGTLNYSSFIHITAIDEHLKNQINIFPNPVMDKLNIITDGENLIKEIIVYNQTGQIIRKNIPVDDHSINIDFTDLSEGLYFLSIQINNEKFYKKILHIK
ncbi:MAG: T9SS type A sorting domain-containing protein [Bacteroidetes bacterium]|nr:T9SS type A sorting domain-containing protein [Bacteroidota bacterium]